MALRVEAESLLAVDVGANTTRAVLFDMVEGRYRFMAAGSAPTTAGVPYWNVSEGVRLALDQLHQITGRVFVGSDQRLIIPTAQDGSGVDHFAATYSLGDPVRVVAIGLLESLSLESARRLAQSTYSEVVDCFSLNDRRRTDSRLNAIIQLSPHLLIAAGGTEDGAEQTVLKLLEAVGLAGYLQSNGHKPELLFAGNAAVRLEVENALQSHVNLHFAPNVRPEIDTEELDAAHSVLARLVTNLHMRQIGGLDELNDWANGGLMPGQSAFGRVIRFLSKILGTHKSVLGVDLGGAAATVAGALDGRLSLNVFPQYGMGVFPAGELKSPLSVQNPQLLKEITSWVTGEADEDDVLNYVYNRALYPGSVPAVSEEMDLEFALMRRSLLGATRSAAANLRAFGTRSFEAGVLPGFDAIIAAGSVFVRIPTPAQAAIILLDGTQPTGVSTVMLDQHGILPVLGAAAPLNPLLVSQVIAPSSFSYLGTVISPVSHTRPGTPILRVKMTDESGHESGVEVKQGTLEVLPLPAGQTARLQIHALHRADVGMGSPGRGGVLRGVSGGVLGVVIDARGRPLCLPQDRSRRRDLYKKWLQALGGSRG